MSNFDDESRPYPKASASLVEHYFRAQGLDSMAGRTPTTVVVVKNKPTTVVVVKNKPTTVVVVKNKPPAKGAATETQRLAENREILTRYLNQ